jgi:hypothetical protein
MLVEDANRRPAPIARKGGRGTLCETTKPARPEIWKDAIPKGMVPGNLFYRQEREAAGRRGQEEV